MSKHPFHSTRIAVLSTALWCLALSGCDPCPTYCSEECACAGDDSEACVDACLSTMDVYSEDAREAECSERLQALQADCF
jgi:hypothetical protein